MTASISSVNPLTKYPYSPFTRGVSWAALRAGNLQPSASVVPSAPTPILNLNHAAGIGSPSSTLEEQLDPSLRLNALA